MASAFQVQAPESFNFSSPSEWPKWKRRFERFRIASGLDQKKEEEQVNTLIYMMGDQADDILLSFKLTADELKKYDIVLEKFEKHFIVRRNTIYERAKFNSRIQQEGESVDTFITSLYGLAEHCEYGALHDEMIRDRIVVGVRDKKISEKLQLDNKLKLETAIVTVRQNEAVKRQQQELNGTDIAKSVDRVFQKNQAGKSQQSKSKESSREDRKETNCGRCGRKSHLLSDCPAKDAECHNCKKKGHFAKQCRSKKTGVQAVSSNQENEGFVGTVELEQRKARWTATVGVNGVPIEFKLDPGADVTVIPLYTYKRKWKSKKLESPDQSLRGADGGRLETVGMFDAQMTNKSKISNEKVYVVRGLERPLLGLPACERLDLVRRVDSVEGGRKTKVDPKQEYPKLFTGLGTLDQPYEIRLTPDAQPYAIHTPRRVPIPMMDKLKTKLKEMVQQGVIEAVDEPTKWCSPLVIAPKGNGDVRVCVDLTRLNKYVERELHTMPVVEHTLGQLQGAKVFSKLDANSGFWQVKLDEKSALLTTFMTPFGRYCYKRMPFGITSAPEHYQKRMSQILCGVEGVVCQMDDILIFGSSVEEHDQRLRLVLQKLAKAGITLNDKKCVFGVESVTFLGHIIDQDGIRADPKKVEALLNLPKPKDVGDVRRFLGMVNYFGRFISNLSDLSQPLNELLKKDNDWYWGPSQQQSFQALKKVMTEEPVLCLFDMKNPTVVSADSSSYGLGAVLKQKQQDGSFRAVAYASRTLSPTEKRYAQIEREALAITWACERFQDFVTGMEFDIETDHQPLLAIFTTKDLDDLTPRLQRFRMRMMRYSYGIFHTPGKDLVVADALSRQPLDEIGDGEFEKEVTVYVNSIVSHLPTSDEQLKQIWIAQNEDPTLMKVNEYCEKGWPEKKKLDAACQKFWALRYEIANVDGLLMRNCRIIVPSVLQDDILQRIHSGHLGITKCRARARESVWWPGLSTQIEELIKKCPECVKEVQSHKEPLMPSEFPQQPWQKVAMDLFYSNGESYLIVTDYNSRYPEIARLENQTAKAVINHCKSNFARHGVPELVISDNGPQFKKLTISEFAEFAKDYGFKHTTSSPRYPQSNGLAEAAVKIIKQRLKKSNDPYKALLEYRATPLQNGYSPAELLMGRRIRTTLPTVAKNLMPHAVSYEDLKGKEEKRRVKQKENFDQHHGVNEKEDLQQNDNVWITDMRTWGKIESKADTPRSFIVKTPRGTVRRNRFHLTKARFEIPDEQESDPEETNLEAPVVQEEQCVPASNNPPIVETPVIRTKSGRVVKPVQRLNL